MFEEEARPSDELEHDEHAADEVESDDSVAHVRRRPPVADWGGDELFNHPPRRRFARAGAASHARRPSASPITSHQLRRNADSGPAPARPGDRRADSIHEDGAWSASHGLGLDPRITIYEPDADLALRTDDARAARDRRRPRRSVDDHVGARPDRIAAWAFALGLMLILLAVGTADAAMVAIQ